MENNNLKRAQSLVGTSEGRPDGDFYPTPKSGTRVLLANEKFNGMIWEPACGEGAMSEVIKSYGYDVLSTDIHDYDYDGMECVMDFMNVNSYDVTVDNIITNPPFSINVGGKKKGCQVFVEKALSVTTKKVAILQKLAFLEGKDRKSMFERTPLKHVLVFSKRLTMYRGGMKMKNSGMIPFAWYIWDHEYNGPPI